MAICLSGANIALEDDIENRIVIEFDSRLSTYTQSAQYKHAILSLLRMTLPESTLIAPIYEVHVETRDEFRNPTSSIGIITKKNSTDIEGSIAINQTHVFIPNQNNKLITALSMSDGRLWIQPLLIDRPGAGFYDAIIKMDKISGQNVHTVDMTRLSHASGYTMRFYSVTGHKIVYESNPITYQIGNTLYLIGSGSSTGSQRYYITAFEGILGVRPCK